MNKLATVCVIVATFALLAGLNIFIGAYARQGCQRFPGTEICVTDFAR